MLEVKLTFMLVCSSYQSFRCCGDKFNVFVILSIEGFRSWENIRIFGNYQSTWELLALKGEPLLRNHLFNKKFLSQMLERCKTAEEATTLSKGCQDLLFEVNCLSHFVTLILFTFLIV